MRKLLLVLSFCILASSANAQQVIKICTQVSGSLAPSCVPVSSTNPLPVTTSGTPVSNVSIGTSTSFTNPHIVGENNSGFWTPSTGTVGYIGNGGTAGSYFGPVIFDNNGRIIIGGPLSEANSNNSSLELDCQTTGGGNTCQVVPIQMNQWISGAAAVQPIVFWRSRGATFGSSGILQSGDNMGLLQASGDDGAGNNNANSVNMAFKVDSLSGSSCDAIGVKDIPGEVLIQTHNGAQSPSGMNSVLAARCNGDVDVVYGNIVMGASPRVTVIDSSHNGFFNNVTVAGTLAFTAALAPPSAGDGEFGGYAPRELTATNLLLQSNSFCTSPWTDTNATCAGASTISPDGTADAVTMTTSASGGKALQSGMTIPSDSTTWYTSSAYFNSGSAAGSWQIRQTFVSGTSYSITYNTSTAAITCTTNATCHVLKLGQLANDGTQWYRLTITAQNAGQTQLRQEIFPNGSGAASNSIVWGAQAEAQPYTNTYPTQQIPTTTVAVVRLPNSSLASSFVPTGTSLPTDGMFLSGAVNTLGFSDRGLTSLTLTNVASAVDYLAISGVATANPANPSITATGTDANVGISLVSKGTGNININGNLASIGGGAPTCGAGCSSITANSTNTRGSMVSGASVSAITVNWSTTLPNTPFCVISDSNTSTVSDISAISTSAMTVNLASALSAVTIYWHCMQ